MSAQALYRKWRSQTFEEVIGQEHVTRTLKNAVREGRLSHAYLFCGPRGTGKTSTARILAKVVNCLAEPGRRPCNECSICKAISSGQLLDLIEIDAASNTSVDDIRDLRDKVGFRPNEARMKFYIIDEVHMLSNSAFNALLKTLEEPPPHVIFVLCTTEPHRIPATVLSRCQRFDFHRISVRDISDHLARIASAEGFEAEPAALEMIARAATGSMRDAVSLLDQVLAYADKRVTVDHVREVLGAVSDQVLAEIVGAVADGDAAAGLSTLNRLVMQGVDLQDLAKQLLGLLRNLLHVKAGEPMELLALGPEQQAIARDLASRFSVARLVTCIREFSKAAVDVRTSVHPQLPLELAILQAALTAEEQAGVPAAQEPARPAAPVPQQGEMATAPAKETVDVAVSTVETPSTLSGEEKLALLRRSWPEVKEELQAKSPAAVGLLSARRGVRFMAIEGDEVLIAYRPSARYSVERVLQQPEVVAALEDVLSRLFGAPHRVKYVPEGERSDTGRGDARTHREEGASSGSASFVDPLVKSAIDQWGATAEEL